MQIPVSSAHELENHKLVYHIDGVYFEYFCSQMFDKPIPSPHINAYLPDIFNINSLPFLPWNLTLSY